jgi:hypothetical protein
MKYVFLMALVMQSYGAFAAETAKTATTTKTNPVKTEAKRSTASVAPAASDVEAKGDVDSMLGEMQSALEKSDSAMDMDANPE